MTFLQNMIDNYQAEQRANKRLKQDIKDNEKILSLPVKQLDMKPTHYIEGAFNYQSYDVKIKICTSGGDVFNGIDPEYTQIDLLDTKWKNDKRFLSTNDLESLPKVKDGTYNSEVKEASRTLDLQLLVNSDQNKLPQATGKAFSYKGEALAATNTYTLHANAEKFHYIHDKGFKFQKLETKSVDEDSLSNIQKNIATYIPSTEHLAYQLNSIGIYVAADLVKSDKWQNKLNPADVNALTTTLAEYGIDMSAKKKYKNEEMEMIITERKAKQGMNF